MLKAISHMKTIELIVITDPKLYTGIFCLNLCNKIL